MLRDAVLNGIPSLILRNDIPLKERTTICELLNKKSDYRWTLKRGTLPVAIATNHQHLQLAKGQRQ